MLTGDYEPVRSLPTPIAIQQLIRMFDGLGLPEFVLHCTLPPTPIEVRCKMWRIPYDTPLGELTAFPVGA